MSSVPPLFGEGRAVSAAFVTAGAVGQALAAGVAAFATRDIFHSLHRGEGDMPAAPLALLFLAGLAAAGLRVVERTLAEALGQDYAISLRLKLFGHLTRMPVGAVAGRRAGALALRFVGDLAAARLWVGLSVARIISAAIVVPGGAVVLFVLNPDLAAAAVPPLVLSLVVMIAVAPRIAPLHKRLRGRRARLAIDMMERVSSAPELLLMGRERSEIRRLNQRGRDLKNAAVRRILGAASLQGLPELGTAAAAAALLWAAFATGAAPAEAAAGLAVLGIVVQPMRHLAGVWDRRCAWGVARAKCDNVLSSPPLDRSAETADLDEGGPARIAFQAVAKGVLGNLEALAAPGTKVAILGANGTGKSTCLALAAGLEQADSGAVEIDGVDIRALSHSERHRTILYVGPRSPILQGTLRRALTLGIRPRPDDAVIKATAREFGLGDVLDRLGGLDARVAEGGRNLSSGEARRFHLVRAALAKPRLLLLDEPDDALDPAGRKALERLLLQSSATTLHVTSDLNLARRADVAWYLQGGAIIDQGAPDEVLLGHGPAAHFFRLRCAA